MENNKIKDMLPLITIIVGIYKGEKYLKECIESIIIQDYPNLEIILVDDGSPDNSGKIVDEYAMKDNRIKIIHQKNSGVSISRNNALDISSGKYICIIDQDDVISKNYITYFYDLIIKNNAEISITPNVDKFFGNINNCEFKRDKVKIWTGEKAATEMLYHNLVIAPWNKMISRELIERNHIRFNPNFFGGEGFAFSVECFQRATRVAVGNQKVYHYRVGDPESGASKFNLKTINSSIEAQKYIKNNFIKDTDELKCAWNFSNWHTHCDCLNIMVGCKVTNKYKELYNNIKEICQKEALCALKSPIPLQQKIRGILFRINPFIASKIINHFRIRKFKAEL